MKSRINWLGAESFLRNCQGIIYLVDACDRKMISKAKEELIVIKNDENVGPF